MFPWKHQLSFSFILLSFKCSLDYRAEDGLNGGPPEKQLLLKGSSPLMNEMYQMYRTYVPMEASAQFQFHLLSFKCSLDYRAEDSPNGGPLQKQLLRKGSSPLMNEMYQMYRTYVPMEASAQFQFHLLSFKCSLDYRAEDSPNGGPLQKQLLRKGSSPLMNEMYQMYRTYVPMEASAQFQFHLLSFKCSLDYRAEDSPNGGPLQKQLLRKGSSPLMNEMCQMYRTYVPMEASAQFQFHLLSFKCSLDYRAEDGPNGGPLQKQLLLKGSSPLMNEMCQMYRTYVPMEASAQFQFHFAIFQV